ncbi:hypothetical protein OKW45_006794 [Paraburkholderia sp. WSM4175]|uniref:hypothetical protein n=1 Tax=Paraburkholderia sp. WSM4175 TaxID=2991072 RepID=UPI003D212DCC
MTTQTSFLLSIPLDQGKYPFALDKKQLEMTGDEWAWKFLRLNPGYRRDYELLRDQPAWLKDPKKPSPQHWQDSEWFERAKELDVRYYSQNGKVLGPQCKWPHAEPVALSAFLETRPDIKLRDLRVRDFDSTRLYGIGDWFDPSERTLPKLATGQSWFFNLTDPIYEIGMPFFAGRESVWKISPLGNRISVGYTGQAKFIESPVVYGQIESCNDLGERVISFGRIDNLPPQRVLQMRDKDRKLIRNINAPAITPFPLAGFTRQSEMAFAVSLDANIKPQLHANQEAAQQFQELLCRTSLLHVADRVPTDSEPQVFPFLPNRTATIPFNAIRKELSDLAREPASAWQNWHVVLIDVAHHLPRQFEIIGAQLYAVQQRLGPSKRLANSIRQRAGTANPKEFWLKRALCMLELQLVLPKRATSPTGAGRIAKAIYDAADPYHKCIWGESGWQHAPKGPAPDFETCKDALRTGINLAMHQYTFMIGAAPGDLVTGETSS